MKPGASWITIHQGRCHPHTAPGAFTRRRTIRFRIFMEFLSEVDVGGGCGPTRDTGSRTKLRRENPPAAPRVPDRRVAPTHFVRYPRPSPLVPPFTVLTRIPAMPQRRIPPTPARRRAPGTTPSPPAWNPRARHLEVVFNRRRGGMHPERPTGSWRPAIPPSTTLPPEDWSGSSLSPRRGSSALRVGRAPRPPYWDLEVDGRLARKVAWSYPPIPDPLSLRPHTGTTWPSTPGRGWTSAGVDARWVTPQPGGLLTEGGSPPRWWGPSRGAAGTWGWGDRRPPGGSALRLEGPAEHLPPWKASPPEPVVA